MKGKLEERAKLVATIRRDLEARGGTAMTNWARLRSLLTDSQIERIKAKAQWEACTWLGVLRNWPDLFITDTTHQREAEEKR